MRIVYCRFLIPFLIFNKKIGERTCNHITHLRLHFYPQGKGTMGWHRDTGGDNAASYMKGSYAETGVGLLSSVRVDG